MAASARVRARESAVRAPCRQRKRERPRNSSGAAAGDAGTSGSARPSSFYTSKLFDDYDEISIKGVPEYLVFNRCILSGYRVNFTTKDSFFSLFTLHNETLNIWTHVAGFLIFLCLLLALAFSPARPPIVKHVHKQLESLQHRLEKFEEGAMENIERSILSPLSNITVNPEYWPMYTYLLGAMACMLCSSLAHTFSICSPRANMLWWRMDYFGIAIMICTSFYPIVYYLFLHNFYWCTFYLSAITLLGGLVSYVSLTEKFQDNAYRKFRAWIFFAMAAFGVFPILHGMIKFNFFHNESLWNVLSYEVVMAVLYVGGVIIYAIQFPECHYPGKFDIFFNSHQLFHVAIVLAAYSHYVAGMTAIDWRYGPSTAG